jgi:hypothetical protein
MIQIINKEEKMLRTIKFFSVVFLFSVIAAAQTPPKKYDIKSGIVTYELLMKVGNFEIKNKIVVYFDDYGLKECRETFSKEKLEQSAFSDGKTLYVIKPNQKTAYDRGSASRGTELRVEWSEFGTEKDKQSGLYKKLAGMTVAGKNCEVFEYNDGKGTITRYAGWNKILMYMESKTSSTETVQKALKIEENIKVPPEKFAVPAGYKIEKS